MNNKAAPSKEIFNEIKDAAISIWKEYDDTYKYATEKIDVIESLADINASILYMYQMFDHKNKSKLIIKLSKPATRFILQLMR